MFDGIRHQLQEPSELANVTTYPDQIDAFHFKVLIQSCWIKISKMEIKFNYNKNSDEYNLTHQSAYVAMYVALYAVF